MKVVIASDKFKGSLSSQEVADSIEEGIRMAMPDCDITKLFVADGGDGTAEAIVHTLSGNWVTTTVHDPLNRPIEAKYGIINEDTAVLDVATASGLALLNANEANPLLTTSFGTGELIRHAIENGIRKFLIGVGGSATNDAAMGILQALGFQFLDAKGKQLFPCGENLLKVTTIDSQNTIPSLKTCDFTILCDVDAAFYGSNGAARLFAPQKGADAKASEILDNGLRAFSSMLKQTTGKSVQHQSYAGAAGGIGGTLWALLDAKLTPGIYTILKTIRFEKAIAHADLVITGEGAIDKLTLLGKTAYGVCGEAAWNGVPTIAFVGKADDTALLNEYGFLAVFPIQPGPVAKEVAMNRKIAYENLKRTTSQVFRTLLVKIKTPTQHSY